MTNKQTELLMLQFVKAVQDPELSETSIDLVTQIMGDLGQYIVGEMEKTGDGELVEVGDGSGTGSMFLAIQLAYLLVKVGDRGMGEGWLDKMIDEYIIEI